MFIVELKKVSDYIIEGKKLKLYLKDLESLPGVGL